MGWALQGSFLLPGNNMRCISPEHAFPWWSGRGIPRIGILAVFAVGFFCAPSGAQRPQNLDEILRSNLRLLQMQDKVSQDRLQKMLDIFRENSGSLNVSPDLIKKWEKAAKLGASLPPDFVEKLGA